MPKFMDKFASGTLAATTGLIAALLVASAGPASAGPFNWFKGKDPNQNYEQQPQAQAPQSGGNGGGLFGGLFGGGSRGGLRGTEHEFAGV